MHKNWLQILGTIYLAYDNALEKEVALKMEKQDKAKRILISEYSYLQRLQGILKVSSTFYIGCPHIVPVYDLIVDDEK